MNVIISNNIIEQLKKQGKSCQELADGIRVDKKIVNEMLNGTQIITAIELNKIASFLGVPMSELVKLPKTPPREVGFVAAFEDKMVSDEGRIALKNADELSDMILFHSRVKENGVKSFEQSEVV